MPAREGAASAASSRSPLRVHSLLGLFPLLGYVLFHAWETTAALGGREAFVLRMGVEASLVRRGLVVILVFVPLVLHAGLGFRRALASRHEPSAAGPYPSRSVRTLEWASGAIVLLFLVGHGVHVASAGPSGLDIYEGLRRDLGRPCVLSLHVVGLTALCLHVAQGIAAAGRTFSARPVSSGGRVLLATATALSLALFLVFLNTLSYFAVGEALLWMPDPA